MIEYVRAKHWDTDDPRMTAYDVFVDGVRIGKIERVLESTDRHYGMIRVPGKGRLAWRWHRADGKRNSPGVYERNRAAAVERMLRDKKLL